MISDTLFYGLATIGFAFLGVAVRYAFKSKCKNVNICYGCVSIERDIQAEIELEEHNIDKGTPTKGQQSFP